MKINKTVNNAAKAFLALSFVLSGFTLTAKENKGVIVPTGGTVKKNQPISVTATPCSNPTASTDLDVNNVRARILGASDMWWDLNSAKYEIPKGTGKTSIFTGALWIGGIDAGGQIKVAGQTYRQTGNDFWTGPIDTVDITIGPDVCAAYDKHFVTTKEDVISYNADKTSISGTPLNTIKNWPGNGDLGLRQGNYLAPFYDANADGIYDPDNGDYPHYLLTGNYSQLVSGYDRLTCNDYLFGDKNLWWVFNDVGAIHTETSSDQIGLEVRAQAFAFNTNDEINNMTFYKYQIINRGSVTLTETYFGQWVDPDLGNAVDDYVGCDVKRGLGFVYNGDEEDENVSGYGLNPPACGVDFFQGPLADVGDSLDGQPIDNDKDGCPNCTFLDSAGTTVSVPDNVLREEIIMSKFVYYNNINNTPDGNPNGFTDYYNYLRGVWLDNLDLTYGGDGRDPLKPKCNYMFPDDTDSALFATEGAWTEVIAGNQPEDRRFLQSAGTFTLLPGAVNYVTTGVVWARANQGGVAPGIELMKSADDKAQALFTNCFKLLDGPDAPPVVIRELKNELVFTLQNTDTSSIEFYNQPDPTIVGVADSLTYFKFQGYKIFQIRDNTVTVADLDNPDKARLVKQMDIRDGVKNLVNFTFDISLGANVPQLMVQGADVGISHSFSVKQDQFAAGTNGLVNNKNYFYMAVSYAYNEYKKYDPLDPNALDGQKKPYLQGRNNVKKYSAIPHSTTPEIGGTFLHSAYGEGPQLQRIDGQGNGGVVLELTDATVNEILTSPAGRSYHPVYETGHGPANVIIYDPVTLAKGNYEVRLDGVADTNIWTMSNLTTALMIKAERNLNTPYEQLIPEWGLSSNISQVIDPGFPNSLNNGFLESEMIFADNSNQWLLGLPDFDNTLYFDWILAGSNATPGTNPDIAGDEKQVYETVVNGTWAPFKLTSPFPPAGPKPDINNINSPTKLENIASVDVIITSDKSKWSRALVVETDDAQLGIGFAKKGLPRKSPSIDKNGSSVFGTPDNNDYDSSMSWFPGYAINLETGERLNIVFGENSFYTEQNGADMIWNPTGRLIDAGGSSVYGGMHNIYVFGHNGDLVTDMPAYDGCKYMKHWLDSSLKVNSLLAVGIQRNAWKDAMWVNIPFTDPSKVIPKAGEMFVPPVDVKVRIRVAKSYKPYISRLPKSLDLLANTEYYVLDSSIVYDGNTYGSKTTFTTNSTALTFSGLGNVVPAPKNNFIPLYTFKTDNQVAETNNSKAISKALDQINVVPNPYYAISGYEGTAGIIGQVDNRIRITNLPSKCTVSIFTTNGTLIKQFKRSAAEDNTKSGIDLENPNTSQDWDLKNTKGITVASGIYLIHVEVPGVGERVIKWFGIMRPVDLDTF